MFPSAHSQIYRNEEGEVLGWDNPSDDPPDAYDEYDDDIGRQIDDEIDNRREDEHRNGDVIFDDDWLEAEYEDRTDIGDE